MLFCTVKEEHNSCYCFKCYLPWHRHCVLVEHCHFLCIWKYTFWWVMCVTGRERDLRPKCEMASVHVCLCVLTLWKLYTCGIQWQEEQLSLCDHWACVWMCLCMCVCVGVWGGKELTLSFMTVSIMSRYDSLLVLRHQCDQFRKGLPNIVNCNSTFCTSEEERLISSAFSLSSLSAKM